MSEVYDRQTNPGLFLLAVVAEVLQCRVVVSLDVAYFVGDVGVTAVRGRGW